MSFLSSLINQLHGLFFVSIIAGVIIYSDILHENINWQYLTQVNEWLEGASIKVKDGFPHISVLDFFGSILACNAYRQICQKPKLWIECLLACTILQFGGTTLTGFVLGQTPSWITSSTAFPALLLAWWLTFFCPFDLYWSLVANNPVFKVFCEHGLAISGSHAVTSWGMDKAIWNVYHVNAYKLKDSVLTCLFCGTLSGCGGGLLGDWLGFLRNPSFTISSTPAIFSLLNKRAPSTITRCFCMALSYYCLLNPSGYLPWTTALTKEDCHMVICIMQLLHTFLCTFSSDLDLFGYLAESCAIVIHPDLPNSPKKSQETNVVVTEKKSKPDVATEIDSTHKKPKKKSKKRKLFSSGTIDKIRQNSVKPKPFSNASLLVEQNIGSFKLQLSSFFNLFVVAVQYWIDIAQIKDEI
eukprot:gene10564-22042_t